MRLSPVDKHLRGSSINIPRFKKLGIVVPDILAEDYSKTLIPYSYQIQTKLPGSDLGKVIETLTDDQLVALAGEVTQIIKKVQTITPSDKFGVVWGGENDFSDSWTQRMRIWIDESRELGTKTGIMDDATVELAEKIYTTYKSYFDSVKPVTYYGDICSKNILVHNGVFSGLVDLDGLTQGDPLESIGRIKTSWYSTHYGDTYTGAIMNGLNLTLVQREMVTVHAILNRIAWSCENGVQYNLNTKPVVDRDRERKDKLLIWAMAGGLTNLD